jgi:hypothetical protein
MRASIHQKVHFVASHTRHETLASTKLASAEGMKKASAMGLVRVAGNMFECPSSKDFWKVEGSKVIRVSSIEVDANEHLKPADADDPSGYLQSILADLDL